MNDWHTARLACGPSDCGTLWPAAPCCPNLSSQEKKRLAFLSVLPGGGRLAGHRQPCGSCDLT